MNLFGIIYMYRNSRSQLFFKIRVLKNFVNFTGKHLCWSLFLSLSVGVSLLKETPTQVFFSEIYEIFKNIFFTEHLRWLLLYILLLHY